MDNDILMIEQQIDNLIICTKGIFEGITFKNEEL